MHPTGSRHAAEETDMSVHVNFWPSRTLTPRPTLFHPPTTFIFTIIGQRVYTFDLTLRITLVQCLALSKVRDHPTVRGLQ